MAPEFSWMRQILDHMELADEILPGQTIIEVIGEGRVLIEGHRGVSAYSDEEVSVNTRFGVVKIVGCNLKLSQMNDIRLIIAGTVSSILLLRRDGA